MAVKLKKRAMAEYHRSAVITESSEALHQCSSSSKKLSMRLILRKSEDSPTSLLPEPSFKSTKDLSYYAVSLSGRLPSLGPEELREIIVKLSDLLESENEDLRSQVLNILILVLRRGPSTKRLTSTLKEKAETLWLSALRDEKKGSEVTPKILCLYATLYQIHPSLTSPKVHKLALEALKDPSHDLQTKALILLGHTASLPGYKGEVVALVAQYTKSSDPRVRSQAFETLLLIHESLSPLGIELYQELEGPLKDDFDRVRGNTLRLISALSRVYPDHLLRYKKEIRLADDAFSKICEGFNDVNVHVRELAANLIGSSQKVSQMFLEQTLDKKLMSNMRLKRSAHEREAKMVSAGEWSSGRNWADDSPKEELDASSVNLMNFGACGAFIHGLEDEYMAVRSASVDSLSKLSIENPELAILALDFLVDMFNDEIEMVRIRAIESLTQIAPHIVLQLHQIETILSALDDYSLVVREKLHIMLQSVCIATKDGLQRVINKLLENLKKYPQDKRSLFLTFKRIGARHPELTLPLVTQLLEIHPFFDTPEPELEEPSYICILILIFNAAEHCPTLEALLDTNTKRHYEYLIDTLPHLVPASLGSKGRGENALPNNNNNQVETIKSSSSATKFLGQVLSRVKDSASRSLVEQITIADRACSDLNRLAAIEPAKSSAAQFLRLYIQAQSLFLRCLKSKFWVNSSHLGIDLIKGNIEAMFRICLELRHRFRVPQDSDIFRQIGELKLIAMALNLLFIVRASNKSALNASEMFIRELNRVVSSYEDEDGSLREEDIQACSPFLYSLLSKLNEEKEDSKPGVIARVVQPLLLSQPLTALSEWPTDEEDFISMASAVIFDPLGNNELPLKYTAGMVLAVPLDAELYGIRDEELHRVRVSIKTPDMKTLNITPRPSEFFRKDPMTVRLLTNALMSHTVWSEAMHVDIGIVLDLSEPSYSHPSAPKSRKKAAVNDERNVIHISEGVKVYILPKAVKRGI